jgi:hypothetical protein
MVEIMGLAAVAAAVAAAAAAVAVAILKETHNGL